MHTSRALALLVGLAAATLAAPARADIPPDPDSADAHCTPPEQCPSGVYCDYAFRPGAPEDEWKNVGADCRSGAASRGLKQRCRNGGNYSGQNLYCPEGETGSWSPGGKVTPPPAPAPAPAPAPGPAPTPAKAGMCNASGPTSPLALLLLLGLVRRRRG